MAPGVVDIDLIERVHSKVNKGSRSFKVVLSNLFGSASVVIIKRDKKGIQVDSDTVLCTVPKTVFNTNLFNPGSAIHLLVTFI